MLGKVMKYELRACGRILLPFFGLAVALSLLFRGMLFVAPKIWEPAGNILTQLAYSIGSLLLIGLVGLTFIYLLVRFWQGMVSNEAYLTFSLPVKSSTHIWGRALTAILFSLAGFLMAIVCAFIFLPNLFQTLTATPLHIGDTQESPFITLASMPANIKGSLLALFLVAMIVGVMTNLFKFYAAFAIGTRFRDRILGSIAGYIILNVAQAILMLPFMLIPLFNMESINAAVAQDFQLLTSSDIWVSLGNVLPVVWLFVGIVFGVALLFMVIHILITHHCYGKRLNLE